MQATAKLQKRDVAAFDRCEFQLISSAGRFLAKCQVDDSRVVPALLYLGIRVVTMLQHPAANLDAVDVPTLARRPDANARFERGEWTNRSARVLEESEFLLLKLERSLMTSQAMVDRSRTAVNSTRAWLGSLHQVKRGRIGE
jgi:hypothetical protein